MTGPEEKPELQADLSDVLRLVAELATIPTMGRRSRQILFALANAGHDVERFDGLVIEGEVYPARWRKSYAACGCRDDAHTWTRDNDWFGRGNWMDNRADAQARVDRIQGHLVTQITAYTPLEVEG